MDNYIPPYTISDRMLALVSSISEKVGTITDHRALESKPHLRKNNRIRSIHSSLKIEANSLSLNEVRDVINGRLVLGDRKEIQEVQNAYNAYEKIGEIDPASIEDLKKIHGIMTYRTVTDAGDFRKSDEGVYSGDRCIFICPPPHLAETLTQSLFSWMKCCCRSEKATPEFQRMSIICWTVWNLTFRIPQMSLWRGSDCGQKNPSGKIIFIRQ